MRLRLTAFGTERIEYVAEGPTWSRPVSVLTRGESVTFPHPLSESGESLGSAELDEHVRSQARGLVTLRAGLR